MYLCNFYINLVRRCRQCFTFRCSLTPLLKINMNAASSSSAQQPQASLLNSSSALSSLCARDKESVRREQFNLLKVEWQNHQNIAADTSTYCLQQMYKTNETPKHHLLSLILHGLWHWTRVYGWAHPTSPEHRRLPDLQKLPAVLGVILPHVLDEVHLLQSFVSWRPRYMLGSAITKKPNISWVL